MRNLMVAALAIYLAAWWLLLPFGNAGLWIAMLMFLVARGILQFARYAPLVRTTFRETATAAP
jgi:MATE family multidrug resistance protein